MLNNQKAGQGHFQILLLVVAVSLIFKLALLCSWKDLPLLGDAQLYWLRSLDTLRHYFSQLDRQAPLYPIFIALNRLVFSEHALLGIKIEQLLLQSLEAILVYALAAKFFQKRTALLSGLIASLYPELVSISYLLFSETLFLFFFLAGTLLYFSATRSQKPANLPLLAGSGLMLGLASLVRGGTFYLLFIFIFHFFCFGRGNWKNKMLGSVVFLVFLAGPVSVQSLKNYRVAGCFILIDTSPFRTLYLHHNTTHPLNMDFRGYSSAEIVNPCAGMSDCEERDCQSETAWRFIKSHPGLTVKHSIIKTLNLYAPNLLLYKMIFNADLVKHPGLKKYQARWFRTFCSLTYLLLVLLALLGLCMSREWELKSLTLLLVLYFTAACAFFLGASRYRLPFIPFLIIYAAFFLSGEWRDHARNRTSMILSGVLLWSIFLYLEFPRLLLVLK